MSDWAKVKLSDFIDINPKIKLEKGKKYSFIEMQNIIPGNRYVTPKIAKEYRGGGAKFNSGDVLFARITPCLENGKIAQVKTMSSNSGFGSTEFFVFRNKENMSDSNYVFYLVNSDIVRKPSEKSMYGASGRQRADLGVIKDLIVNVPRLEAQKKIASILSLYDDLIENNNKRISILEEMARLIYKEWFVKFKFPGCEKGEMIDSKLGKIPEGWEIKTINDIIDVKSGFAFKSKTFIKNGEYGIVTIKNVQDSAFIAQCDNYIDDVPNNMPQHCFLLDGDILLSLTGNIGRVCLFYGDKHLLNQRVAKLVPKQTDHKAFIYFMYAQEIFAKKLIQISTGVAQQNLSPIDMGKIKIAYPSEQVLKKYGNICNPIINEIICLFKKNIVLQQSRDLLLPKLISGGLDVEDVDIDVEKMNDKKLF